MLSSPLAAKELVWVVSEVLEQIYAVDMGTDISRASRNQPHGSS